VRAPIVLLTVAALGASVGMPCLAGEPVDPQKQACADAYDNSQLLRDQRQLTLARAQLVVCQRACPKRLAADCDAWLGDVERRMPAVVLAAVDPAGRAVEARVSVDGQPPTPLPIEPLLLEPGKHAFRFERLADGAVVERSEVLGQGEKGRRVAATFAAVDETGTPGSEATAIALAVVGGAALVVAGVLTIKGHVDRGALYDCRPRCAQDDVDAIATSWTAAGVLAGVGGAALGAAALVWLLGDDGGQPTSGAGGVALGRAGLELRF
jgi:hypothetical protein